jgi:putative endonuclease
MIAGVGGIAGIGTIAGGSHDYRQDVSMAQWHLYMIRTRGGDLYTGVATDVSRRLEEHREGGGRGSRYLRGRMPLRLVFERRIGDRSLALKAESRLKRLRKSRKEQIARSNPTRSELLGRLGIQDG